jgi:hypothetical protein
MKYNSNLFLSDELYFTIYINLLIWLILRLDYLS